MSFANPSSPRPNDARSQAVSRDVPDSEIRRRRALPAEEEYPAIDRPKGSSFRRQVDWQHVGILGAGLLVGAIVGVSVALLFAPQSGIETRTAIRRRARVAKHRAGDAWGDLSDELAAVARRGRRRARRALRRARWHASDAIA